MTDTSRIAPDGPSRVLELVAAGHRVTTDSRSVRPGDIFIALRGASFDGNAFVEQALRSGAEIAVTDSDEVPLSERTVGAADSLAFLQQLARDWRRSIGTTVVGIAGSNGKTTTKELVTAVLRTAYPQTACTVGNLNNHIGVPLTVLSIPADCRMAVVEMGASSCGEIALLCSVCRPDYGILTNIGNAHLEGFGGHEGIIRGKGELYDFLAGNGGTALVREDDPILTGMADQRKGLRAIRYPSSLADGIDSCLTGEYNKYNIAAAMAVARTFGIDPKAAAGAISSYVPTNNRSQIIEGRNRVIADCYNANPSSMAAAIDNIASMQGERMLILGDMRELGSWSRECHTDILSRALRIPEARILLVGAEFGAAAAQAGCERVTCVPDRDAAAAFLTKTAPEGLTVLVKGSHSVGLESLIDLLR